MPKTGKMAVIAKVRWEQGPTSASCNMCNMHTCVRRSLIYNSNDREQLLGNHTNIGTLLFVLKTKSNLNICTWLATKHWMNMCRSRRTRSWKCAQAPPHILIAMACLVPMHWWRASCPVERLHHLNGSVKLCDSYPWLPQWTVDLRYVQWAWYSKIIFSDNFQALLFSKKWIWQSIIQLEYLHRSACKLLRQKTILSNVALLLPSLCNTK